MANINLKISDSVHKQIRHERIDTGKSNCDIIEEALRFYYRSKGVKFEDETTNSETPTMISED